VGEDGVKQGEGNTQKHKQQQKDDESNKATADTAEEGSDPGRAAEEAKALATLRRWVGGWVHWGMGGTGGGQLMGWSNILRTTSLQPDSTGPLNTGRIDSACSMHCCLKVLRLLSGPKGAISQCGACPFQTQLLWSLSQALSVCQLVISQVLLERCLSQESSE